MTWVAQNVQWQMLRILVNNDLGIIPKEVVEAWFRYCPSTCLEKLRDILPKIWTSHLRIQVRSVIASANLLGRTESCINSLPSNIICLGNIKMPNSLLFVCTGGRNLPYLFLLIWLKNTEIHRISYNVIAETSIQALFWHMSKSTEDSSLVNIVFSRMRVKLRPLHLNVGH
jgi:hypothetical protein